MKHSLIVRLGKARRHLTLRRRVCPECHATKQWNTPEGSGRLVTIQCRACKHIYTVNNTDHYTDPNHICHCYKDGDMRGEKP